MKFSYNWLKELSKTEKTPKELGELIMFHAFEVESVESFVHGLEKVVIGRVETVQPHPDADRLRVTTVTVTEGEPARTIVCGAPNVAVGQYVAVALPGAKLPGGIEIKESKIRGVASSGMICAEDELGLGSEHEGILVLPEDAPLGMSFAEYAGLADAILDVNVLPNRGCDAVSYRGLAREIAALEGRRLSFDDERSPLTALPDSTVTVSIESDRCRRYFGILIDGVVTGKSSLRMRSALIRSGLRPINMAVDVTNYLMLLHGQPMHAFDADIVSGGIVVRLASEGETLELLDGSKISLCSEDLVIADTKRPLALAGVMGGSRSGISVTTNRVFLEIASFDPSSIRKTAARHRMPTDASYRFERNVDTDRATDAAIDAIRIFSSDAGATVSGATDMVTRSDEPVTVRFPSSVFRNMFGTGISLPDAKEKLECLGIDVSDDGDEWIAVVPTFRPDLRDGWDFAEEVGRIIGYDGFPPVVPALPMSAPAVNESFRFGRELRNFLAASGWDEITTYSFYSESDAKRFGEGLFARHLRLANPMNPDQAMLRVSLLPTALRKAKENLRYLESFRFFELGDRYLIGEDGKPVEERMLSMILVTRKGEDGFKTLKGSLGKMFRFSNLSEIAWSPLPEGGATGINSLFHPTRTAVISLGDDMLGVAGEIAPFIAEAYGLRGSVVSAQFSFDVLRSAFETVRTYRTLPKFPYAIRDLSLTVSSKVNVGDLGKAIRGASLLLRESDVFDIYAKGEEKNVAFHLSFGRDDRSVTSEEIEREIEGIIAKIGRAYSARLSS
ncbi:MAG: phenylalanine--tRNA ligase subunit beta [Candidatus Moranbacteria bacterium]|nr:phenylalanine--tRNA ligase subunit beta [Candidatus Moranbacteria bacterium]